MEGENEVNITNAGFFDFLKDLTVEIFVTDVETGEILYSNGKISKEHESQVLVGRKCEKLLLDSSDICHNCPVEWLKANPHKTSEREFYDHVKDEWFKITHILSKWHDGRTVHIHQITGITRSAEQDKQLRRKLAQQELMSNMSRNFISIGEPEELINNALAMAGKFMEADRILIGKCDEDAGIVEFIYQWYKNEEVGGVKNPITPFKKGVPIYDELSISHRKYIICQDTREDERFSAQVRFGVISFIIVPIYVSNKLWGILNCVNCKNSTNWSESDAYLCSLVSNIIGGALNRDIMEHELKLMSSVVDSSPYWIAIFNQNMEYEYVNRGAVELTGYSHEELYSKTMMDIIADEESIQASYEANAILAKGKTWQGKLNMRFKDGSVHTFSCSGFLTAKGRFATIAYDVTEEERLKKELLEAKNLAEVSNKAKSEFLSRMSHEMRTPMNAIIGMTSIANNSHDMERMKYCLGKVEDASIHLLGVINDILDMSKIEAGKFELSTQEFVFEKMIERVLNVNNFRIEQKRQNFIVKIDQNVPPVIISDQQRLAQVITNLLSNAVKFTPEEGKISLCVTNIEDYPDDCILKISIKDSGIGISDEQKSRLFKSFEQADGSITRRFGGTGLGLAISKTIVELMGGEINVYSEENEGSEFVFTLKAKKGSNELVNTIDPNIDLQKMRILVIDDMLEVREYFEEIAAGVGIRCMTATDGYDALNILGSNNTFDIIFVDWLMPGLDGIEVTRRIREKFGENIVVIMISSAEWSNIENEAQNVGISGFIAKPLLPSTIVDCINRCAGKGSVSTVKSAQYSGNEGLFQGKKVLLAEDIEINREILCVLLEETQVSIDLAENGKEAYDLFRENQDLYDMIFMDIHMPEMDGFESTRLIRALDTRKAQEIPIVAMTANVFKEDVEKCLAVGMDDHIGKPVEIDEIINKMKYYLLRAYL